MPCKLLHREQTTFIAMTVICQIQIDILQDYGEGIWNKMTQVLIKNHNALPRAPKTIILCSINAQSMECNVFDAFRRNAGLPDGSEIYS